MPKKDFKEGYKQGVKDMLNKVLKEIDEEQFKYSKAMNNEAFVTLEYLKKKLKEVKQDA